MSKQALGKGFEGLLPTGFSISDVVDPSEQIKEINLGDLTPNPDQPRKNFDDTALKELAESIKEHGIVQPIIATPTASGKYRIVAGERRFRAASIAGLKKVPVVIRKHEQLQELEIALIENVQRVDLSPIEQALSIVRLRDQFSLSAQDIARKLGKAETTISNSIRLLHLPEAALEALQKQLITEGHARSILALKFSATAQDTLLDHILKDSWSVRQAEEFVKNEKVRLEQKNSSISSDAKRRVEDLTSKGMKLKLQERKRGGSVTIFYDDTNELERILERL